MKQNIEMWEKFRALVFEKLHRGSIDDPYLQLPSLGSVLSTYPKKDSHFTLYNYRFIEEGISGFVTESFDFFYSLHEPDVVEETPLQKLGSMFYYFVVLTLSEDFRSLFVGNDIFMGTKNYSDFYKGFFSNVTCDYDTGICYLFKLLELKKAYIYKNEKHIKRTVKSYIECLIYSSTLHMYNRHGVGVCSMERFVELVLDSQCERLSREPI